jgi:hypothetical protein
MRRGPRLEGPALVLVLMFTLPACAARSGLSFRDPPPIDPKNRARCEVGPGDKSEVRACLVPSGAEHDPSKQVGENCYWRRFDSSTVFHVKANGRNRRFIFEVVNLCESSFKVQTEFAEVKGLPLLEFVSTGCGLNDPRPPRPVPGQGNDAAVCDTKRYTGGGKKRYAREVKFYVDYNGQKVYFDPEIAVKDAS